MSGFVTLLVIMLTLSGLLAAGLVLIYNRLVTLRARFENAFAQIEVQLTRRYELIPNIVEVAKAYLKHEGDTLLTVIDARNSALHSLRTAAAHPDDPAAIASLNMAEKKLADNFGGLRVQMEAYPELKGNSVMMQLSEELAATENRVAFARQAFNDAVTAYNVQRNRFPANMAAGVFGHNQDAALLT
ncbi:LemA family protein, partial [Desulfovibrio sp. OttesenSCG-928-A18]|nr:LemA family protein [Desulfovibrio sp. OttesenSCG-928-A18]